MCSTSGWAQNSLIINYDRETYGAKSQNWSIATDKQGRLYFGNNDGVLEFDGYSWVLYQHPSDLTARALYYDDFSDRLYVGYYEDFGYWARDKYGQFVYTSLVSPDDHLIEGNSVWSIEKSGQEIIFQTFSGIFSYNEQLNLAKRIADTGSFLFVDKVDNTIYFRNNMKGIFSLQDGDLTVEDGSDFAMGTTARFYLKHPNGTIVGDGEHGLLLLKNNRLTAWECEANDVLKRYSVNCGLAINDRLYAIGTLQNGVYIINRNGDLLEHINQFSGLENNTILSIALDKSGNIWAGLDNGISRIVLDSDISYYTNKTVLPYSVYHSKVFRGKLYLGTNSGIYYTAFKTYDQLTVDVLQLQTSPEHVWKMEIIDEQLLCGSNGGLFQIEGATAIPLFEDSGVTDFKLVQTNDVPLLLASTYNGIHVFRKRDGQWRASHHIDDFSRPCRKMEIYHDQSIWMSDEVKGLYRINLNPTFDKLQSVRKFGQMDGLPTDYHLDVFKVMNRIVVPTSNGVFTYDDLNRAMVPFDQLNKVLKNFGNIYGFSSVDEKSFWVIGDKKVAHLRNGHHAIELVHTYTLSAGFTFPDIYQNISIIDQQAVLCLENGIAVTNESNTRKASNDSLFITSIETSQSFGENHLSLPISGDDNVVLKNNQNSLWFTLKSYANPSMGLTFQYRIRGLQEEWVSHEDGNVIAFPSLKPDDYIIDFRTRASDGSVSSSISYQFTILGILGSNPWLLILVIGVVMFWSALLIVRNRREKKKIHASFQVERKQSQETIDGLREEIQAKQLEELHTQLAISANDLVKRDEAIHSLKKELNTVYTNLAGRLPQREYNRIVKKLDALIADQDKDKADFEEHFSASQSGFYKRIKKDHPTLTTTELRLCSLLKMNMNTKEIASYLGIAARSVEVSRYRLRKKLELQSDANLFEYMMNYSK